MRPKLIAHRGDHRQAPENSMAAFDAAARFGCDGIELDVMLSKDHHVVVTHDDSLKRVFGVDQKVSSLTRLQLESLRRSDDVAICFLDEVLSEFCNRFSVINVELKSDHVLAWKLAELTCDVVKKCKRPEVVRFSSFHPVLIWRAHKLMPHLDWAYLICLEQTKLIRSEFFIERLKPQNLHLHNGEQNHPETRFLFERSEPQWIWTVNTEADFRYWFARNVEALVTDRPDLFKIVGNE